MGIKQCMVYGGLLLVVLISCKGTSEVSKEGDIIDVASALSEPAELKASDYFTHIRYQPLETTEEGLVGQDPEIRFFGDKLVVASARQKLCLLFDAATGRFIRSVGHIGNDPEGSQSVNFWVNEPAQTLHLEGWNGDWQQYDNQGNYLGKVNFPVDPATVNFFTYVDEQTTAAFSFNQFAGKPDSLYFSHGTKLLHAIPALPEGMVRPVMSMGDVVGVEILRGEETYGRFGPAALSGLVLLNLKDDKAAFGFNGSTFFWHVGDAHYFKGYFNDTIYRVKDMRLIPDRVFGLGSYHWPISEALNKEYGKSAFITHVLENAGLMLFRFTVNLFDNDARRTYNALYDKRTGKVRLNLFSEGISDDLAGFLPLQPVCVSSGGEYACLLQAADVVAWFKEHPDAKLPVELQPLKQVKEEDNPVIVFLK